MSQKKPDPATAPSQRMVFVSHANPEDNVFASWLALQLANEGYPVWCDLTKLLGGEAFWEDIQRAIKGQTSKFVFVLSRSSNQKKGTLDELDCALGVAKQRNDSLKDFVIPVKIDDLPYDDTYIGIRRLNSISFTPSWAKGLAQLLNKLSEDGVPKDSKFNPDAVSSWWRSSAEFSAEQGVVSCPDEHLSNWLEVLLPQNIHRHSVSRRTTGKIEFDPATFCYPAVKETDLSFLAFASPETFDADLAASGLYIARSERLETDVFFERGTAPRGYPILLSQLVRQAWEKRLSAAGMFVYELSNRSKSFFFKKDQIKDDRLHFVGVDEKRTYRDIIGYSTRKDRTRYWHYAISARPDFRPLPHLVIKGHVIFSNDGQTIWESKDALAKARRSQCKNWWNDEWRDRMLAVLSMLQEDGKILLPAAPDVAIELPANPIPFLSDTSYRLLDEADRELDDYAFEDEGDDSPEGEDSLA